MARPSRPGKKPKAPKTLAKPKVDPHLAALAQTLQSGHGHDRSAIMALAEDIGQPRGFIGTRNIAIDRAVGNRGGLPMGRMIEISGWEHSGKSTCLDQTIAQCQAMGGIAMLADTEEARDRPYMLALGVQPSALVWALGGSVEEMFNQVETFARNIAHLNTIAWVEALRRAGYRCPDPPMEAHQTYDGRHKDGKGNRKKLAQFNFALWGRAQAACLLEYQKANDLVLSGMRDSATREQLRPVVLSGDDDERADALDCWLREEEHPHAVTADRPVVIGWDSVAGTASEKELEGDAYTVTVAEAAKAIKRNFRRLTMLLSNEAICFILCNQRYEVIEMGGPPRPGNAPKKSKTYGGSGIPYHMSVRIALERRAQIWRTDSDKKAGVPPMGGVIKLRMEKNKVGGTTYRTEEYGLVHGRGCDNAYALFHDLSSRGIIMQAGGWYRFTDTSIMDSEPGGNKNWRAGWMGLSDLMADPQYPGLWSRLHQIYMDAI